MESAVSTASDRLGFDMVPPQRCQEAFRMNNGGWLAQLKNVAAHVAKP